MQQDGESPSRYLHFGWEFHGWYTLSLIDGDATVKLRVPLEGKREALAFALQVARTAELILIVEEPGTWMTVKL